MRYFRTPPAHALENPPIEELQWLIGKLPFPFFPNNPQHTAGGRAAAKG
jgi:hypothetical protein